MDLSDRALAHAALGDERRLAIADLLTEGDRTVGELAVATGLPGNLLAHHLDVMESAGLLQRRVSEGDRRRRYVVLRQGVVAALAPFSRRLDHPVLFVCSHNSARSQYAAARWKAQTGGEADSAGSSPAGKVHPIAVRVASERGLDLSGAVPKGYDSVFRRPAMVISVCDQAHEAPMPDGDTARHWSVPDPVTMGSVSAFRSAFAEIDARIEALAGRPG